MDSTAAAAPHTGQDSLYSPCPVHQALCNRRSDETAVISMCHTNTHNHATAMCVCSYRITLCG